MPTTNDRRPTTSPSTRIGYGFDSHEFQMGIPLKIGGVVLAHDKGLGGHSDGDVLLHAITDALLGAVAAPDIGALFPPSDPKWKGADSVVFLREALKRVRDAGYGVANMDASLILAAPKIGPHAVAIRNRVEEDAEEEDEEILSYFGCASTAWISAAWASPALIFAA
jgi:2-C-methyl-D-erythritol 2,4-cyclodiphosphate synthase